MTAISPRKEEDRGIEGEEAVSNQQQEEEGVNTTGEVKGGLRTRKVPEGGTLALELIREALLGRVQTARCRSSCFDLAFPAQAPKQKNDNDTSLRQVKPTVL